MLERFLGKNPPVLGSPDAPGRDPRTYLRKVGSTGLSGSAVMATGMKFARNGIREVVPTFRAEIDFVTAMDIAERASNGLRKSLLVKNGENSGKKSEFGAFVLRAFENPAESDHNYEHMRRVERWLEALFMNVPEIRTKPIEKWVDSAFLSAYWHDFDQLMSIQRNSENGTSLPVKKGHSLGASVMLLALHKRYAAQRGVSVEEAWRITAGAAVMMVPHELPESLEKSFSATKSAVGLSGEELIDSFNNNCLDLTSLSPQQLVALLRHEKKDFPEVAAETDAFGLHPLFEEEYKSELKELENDTRPLLSEMSDNDKKGLVTAAEAAVWADWTDMIAPPVEAILRTLHNQRSRSRQFMIGRDQMEQLGHQLGYDATDHQTLLTRIISEGPGNIPSELDSDVRRMLWEFAHTDIFTGTVVGDSTFSRRVNVENALMGLYAFRTIGTGIMSGDFTTFDKANRARIEKIKAKGLRKIKKGTCTMSELRKKIIALEDEVDRLKNDFAQKPQGSAPESIEFFIKACDLVIEMVSNRYNVSHIRKAKLERRARTGSFPPSTPFNTYNSLGRPEDIRTLFKA